jgi:hypothetical protein
MPREQYRDPSSIQILGLYLLLFAFFILLFNLSRTEEFKSKSVARSLNTTFAKQGQLQDTPEIFVSAEGDVVATPRKIAEKLGNLVKTAIPIANIEMLEAGRVLRARFPVAELFDPGSAVLRPDIMDKIRRIAREIANPPLGGRYDMEARFSGTRDRDEKSVLVQARTVARAGHLARTFLEMGAPTGTIATGIVVGSPGWVTLLFHLRSRKEAKMALDPAVTGIPR